ncbi:MAG: hypothetical protein R2760_01840 [Chitinophagales bacterium]
MTNLRHKSNFIFFTIISTLLIFISCKKENNNHSLTQEQKRVQLNKDAALIMAKIVEDTEVRQEIYESVRAITKQYEWRDEAVYFKEILPNNYNTILNKESKIALFIRKELNKNNTNKPLNPSSNKKITNEALQFINDLIEYDIEFYFPYHEDFPTPNNFAVTYQNEISEDENEGFIYIQDKEQLLLVNESYALESPVLIIGQFNNNRYAPTSRSENKRNILDPMYFDWGYVKCYEMHEGLLKGGPEIRITTTDVTILGNNATAFPNNTAYANFSRKEVKNKVVKEIHQVFDQSWELLEIEKRIHVYEDDRDGIMGQIKNIIMPIQVQIPAIGVISVNAGLTISNKDEDLGHIQYNRSSIFNFYLKNSTFFGHGTDPQGFPYFKHNGGVYYSFDRKIN